MLFATLVMGGLDFGYFFYSQQVVANAAREGARAGTLTDPTMSSQTATATARAAASTYMQNYGISCRPGGGYACVTSSNPTVTDAGVVMPSIDVAIQYDYASLTGFMNGLTPKHIIGHAIMRWK